MPLARFASVIHCALAAGLAAMATPALGAYSCGVSGGGSIDFLAYDPFGVPATASTTVTLTCNHLGGGNEFINWTMTLTNGSSGTCTARQMQRQGSPSAALGYNVYQGATSTVWGNASCMTFPSGTLQVNNGNPAASTIQTMRGVLPAGQSVPAGSYLDSLVLTISF